MLPPSFFCVRGADGTFFFAKRLFLSVAYCKMRFPHSNIARRHCNNYDSAIKNRHE